MYQRPICTRTNVLNLLKSTHAQHHHRREHTHTHTRYTPIQCICERKIISVKNGHISSTTNKEFHEKDVEREKKRKGEPSNEDTFYLVSFLLLFAIHVRILRFWTCTFMVVWWMVHTYTRASSACNLYALKWEARKAIYLRITFHRMGFLWRARTRVRMQFNSDMLVLRIEVIEQCFCVAWWLLLLLLPLPENVAQIKIRHPSSHISFLYTHERVCALHASNHKFTLFPHSLRTPQLVRINRRRRREKKKRSRRIFCHHYWRRFWAHFHPKLYEWMMSDTCSRTDIKNETCCVVNVLKNYLAWGMTNKWQRIFDEPKKKMEEREESIQQVLRWSGKTHLYRRDQLFGRLKSVRRIYAQVVMEENDPFRWSFHHSILYMAKWENRKRPRQRAFEISLELSNWKSISECNRTGAVRSSMIFHSSCAFAVWGGGARCE